VRSIERIGISEIGIGVGPVFGPISGWADFAGRMVNGWLKRVPSRFCHQSAVYHKNACFAGIGRGTAHGL
jgi:hypothetical protein